VIGTTGFAPAGLEEIRAAAREIAIVMAPNMSIGVNVMLRVVETAARALGPDYDTEVFEIHHKMKVDAPSGTALLLGEAAAEGRQIRLADNAVRGRDGITGAREAGTIGFASLRGGTVAGDHSVYFLADNERISLSHLAENRLIFARGAVRAAQWLVGKGPGRYRMPEVLGL